jgi:hypothetical protein
MVTAAGVWNFRKYGTAGDPIHKSHLTKITGDYGCPKAFRYEQDARAAGQRERGSVSAKAALGTASHETISRALTNPKVCPALLAGTGTITSAQVRTVLEHELDLEIGSRIVDWYGDDRSELIAERVAMICGVLHDVHKYVAEVVLVEPGFVVQLDRYWLSGHIDLLYRPRAAPDKLAICDWKTGATKPLEIELDHSWEAGVYASAVHAGWFITREAVHLAQTPGGGSWEAQCHGERAVDPSRFIAQREVLEAALIDVARDVEAVPVTELTGARRFDEFPTEIYHVHLADYVPYQKAGSKAAKRGEDLRFYNLDAPAQVKYVKGDRRGPAWLPVRRTEHDVPRVKHRLRNIVGMIRLGKFIDQIGEKCRRCPYAAECLTTGYAVEGDERAQLELALRAVGGDAAASAELDE